MKNLIFPLLASCIIAFSLLTGTAGAQITIVNQVEGFLGATKTQVATAHNGTTQVSYNATGVDKLVVVYAGESGFNNQATISLSMAFNGVPMTLAAFDNTKSLPPGTPGGNDGGAVGLFYLDNPFQGAANFTAGMVNSGGGPNGGHVSIIGLADTLDGVGNANATYSTGGGGNVSTILTTTRDDSLVIAGIENSGANNVVGAIPAAVGPLTLSNNGLWGGNWGHGASGYQSVALSGTSVSPTFTTGTGQNIHVVAAEFIVVPEPSSMALLSLMFLSLVGLRRRR